MRRTALVTAVSIVLGLGLAAPAARAANDVAVALPMTSFRDIAVDADHGHVFLTAGGSTGVVVRAFDGGAVTTILDQPGANGLALSPDHTKLYVALELGDGVSVIDTTTLVQVARYSTGVATCPATLSAVGDLVWFGYGCDQWQSDIGVIDLSGDTPVVTLGLIPGESTSSLQYLPPRIQATPDGTRLVAASFGLHPSTLNSFAVSGTTLSTNPAALGFEGDVRDFAVTDDSSDVVVAADATYSHRRFATSDLSADGVYDSGNLYPNAVAVAGGFVAGGVAAPNAADIRVYRADGLLIRTYELGRELTPAGLAMTPDGGTLFAVSGVVEQQHYLHVLHDPTKIPTAITLTKPATAKINAAYTVTGSIGSGVGSGATIHVARSSTYGIVALPDVTTTTGGAFSFPDLVAKRGTYTYTATYDGGPDYAGTSKALSFPVTGLTPSLYLSANAAAYPFHATATFTGRLGATSSSRALRLSVTPYGYGTTVLKTANVDTNGYLSASYTITRRTTFTASFLGDDVYEPRSISIVRSSYVSLSQSLSGYYATSGSYRVYHRSVNPVVNDYVSPNRYGACVSYEAQQYVSGAWRTVATNSCIRLSSSSKVAAVFTGAPHAIGSYRIRSTFNGDTSNLRTTGGWLYLRFTT